LWKNRGAFSFTGLAGKKTARAARLLVKVQLRGQAVLQREVEKH